MSRAPSRKPKPTRKPKPSREPDLFPAPCSIPDRIPDAELDYRPGFLAPEEADTLLAQLLALPDWASEQLRMFGREIDTPRLTAWYGDPGVSYAYSGVVHEARLWPPEVARLRDRLHDELGVRFNGVLGNLYRDGRDAMGWHSDDERELGPRPVIASVSLGAARRFRLRHRSSADAPSLDLPLEHGSLLVMRGDTQRCWRHCAPRTARTCSARVNLTFRRIVPARGQRSSKPS